MWVPRVVVIVDDQEFSRATYALGLMAMGFYPTVAETVDEAFARACSCHPDAIVTNVTERGASLLEFIRRVREDARTRDAAILVLAERANHLRQEAFEAGCDGFMLKPCSPDQLAVEIHGLLNARDRGVHPIP